MNEELLNAWLRLSTAINTDCFISDMTYNESLICNLLYRNRSYGEGRKLTATDLCDKTNILKSQMNRTLNEMEKKHLIRRERSTQDKRQVFISLDMAQIEIYERQHRKILSLIDTLLDRVGREKGNDILKLFNEIADTALEVLK